MGIKTLKVRLLVASIIIMPLALGSTGYALEQAFKHSLQAAERVRLERYFYLLFSLAELDDSTGTPHLTMPKTLLEPDLEQPGSAVTGFIFNPKQQLIWRSHSSRFMNHLPTSADFARTRAPGQLMIKRQTLGGTDYFFAHFDVLWESPKGHTIPYRFALLHKREAFNHALAAYRGDLWRGLATLAAALLAAQSVLLFWALRPLGRLARSLKRMHRGQSAHLGGRYPAEIQQVVDNLNRVLERETALRKRYSNSLGDLAHSLKTPLAALKATAFKSSTHPLAQHINEQVERMDQVVKYQLQRALSDNQTGVTTAPVNVRHTLQRLAQSLAKIYAEKAVNLRLEVAPRLAFCGAEQDLLEVLGNLLDNAYKYGGQHIVVSAQLSGQRLQITVDDDGPGIAEPLRASTLARGQRLDTSQPGQGIGLAVCADIAASYQGQLTIARAPLGGARFLLTLPGLMS